MRFTWRAQKTALRIGALLVAAAISAGCSGMTPVDLRNNREEGPEKGLFSGSQGEFVILRSGSLKNEQKQESSGSLTTGN